MRKFCLLALALALGGQSLAVAQTEWETFPDPLGTWLDRFMYQETNMENYYVASGNPDENNRGNNPEGLWIGRKNTPPGGPIVEFEFNADFGALITYMEFGLECWNTCDVTIYDMDDAVVATDTFSGGGFDFDHVDILSGATGNGVSRFVFDSTPYGSGNIEGNTSIDNIRVDLIPEPTTAVCFGLLAFAAIRRR